MHDNLICTLYELHLLQDMHLLEATVVISEILACHAHPGVLQCLQIMVSQRGGFTSKKHSNLRK